MTNHYLFYIQSNYNCISYLFLVEVDDIPTVDHFLAHPHSRNVLNVVLSNSTLSLLKLISKKSFSFSIVSKQEISSSNNKSA